MNEILVYRRDARTLDQVPEGRESVAIWRPAVASWVAPNMSSRYAAYTFFHVTGIFGSRDYCAMSLGQGVMYSSMLCVPAYFRWPFMQPQDIQFTYVVTNVKARGRGLALCLLKQGMQQLSRPERSFWYVTDTSNVPSRSLAERAGFELVGRAVRRGRIIKRLIMDEDSR